MGQDIPLPDGWTWTTLGEATKLKQKRVNPQDYPDLPYIGMENVEAHTMRLLGTMPSKEMKSSADSFSPGDVLYGRLRPYLNKVYLPDFEGLCSTEFIIFRQVPNIYSKFLQYFLNSWDFVTFANSLNAGDRPRVKVEQFANYPFPLPPLTEQERIVARIESLFTQLDAGAAGLKRVQAALKRYKASVLKAACEGILTGEQAEGGENSLPIDWYCTQLDEISTKITDGEHIRPNTTDSGVFFLSAKDIRDEGVSFNNPLYVSQKDATKYRLRCNPEFGDVLVVSRGATVGRICIVDTNEVFCLLGSVILLKLNKQVDSKYISYVLKSPNFQKILTGLSGSTAQQAIYLRDIRNIQIPLPSLVKQRQIVAEIDWRLSVSGKVENAVGTALARAARLRQAILKRAFEGRLVTQNPSGKLAETRPEATGPASETPDLVNFKQAKLF